MLVFFSALWIVYFKSVFKVKISSRVIKKNIRAENNIETLPHDTYSEMLGYWNNLKLTQDERRGNKPKRYDRQKLHKSTIGSIKKVRSVEELIQNKNSVSVNKTNKFRSYPGYEDVNDPTTLKYVTFYYKGNKVNKNVYKTVKSMYNPNNKK